MVLIVILFTHERKIPNFYKNFFFYFHILAKIRFINFGGYLMILKTLSILSIIRTTANNLTWMFYREIKFQKECWRGTFPRTNLLVNHKRHCILFHFITLSNWWQCVESSGDIFDFIQPSSFFYHAKLYEIKKIRLY